MSAPPSLGTIKPKPFVALNHFTVPTAGKIQHKLCGVAGGCLQAVWTPPRAWIKCVASSCGQTATEVYSPAPLTQELGQRSQYWIGSPDRRQCITFLSALTHGENCGGNPARDAGAASRRREKRVYRAEAQPLRDRACQRRCCFPQTHAGHAHRPLYSVTRCRCCETGH